MGTPDIVPLVPRSNSFPRDSAPAYLVRVTEENLDYLLTHNNAFPSGKNIIIKLLDIGRGKLPQDVIFFGRVH